MTLRSGGAVDFENPGELKDHSGSIEFKKALLLGHYRKYPNDPEVIESLKKYVKFYLLSINAVKNNKQIKYSLKIYETEKNSLLYNLNGINKDYKVELPKGKYKVKVIVKNFLIFEKTKEKIIDLKKEESIKFEF